MDTECTREIKSESREEIQRPTIEYEIPGPAMSTDKTVFEEAAPDSIELPFWKPDESDNVITHAIYRRLIQRYIQENQTWDSQMRSDMLAESKVLDYRILNSTGVIGSHILHKWMKLKVTWSRFWTLRVMFGPAACARQIWFPEVLKRFPDFALKSAYTGVVPLNFQEVFGLDEWVPPVPTPEECGYGRTRGSKRKAASTGIRCSKRQKGSANGVSTTTTTATATAAAAAMMAATASPTSTFTLQQSPETDIAEEPIETPAAVSRQSMTPLDFDANEVPLPQNIGELRNKFRPCQEMQSSQRNHLDMQNQLRELGDENLYLRQINAIQQRLIEQYQERILRLEAESRVTRRRG